MRSFLLVVVVASALCYGPAAAQAPGGIQRPGSVPGGGMQRPPRDAREPVVGSGVLRGRVVAADSGAPIRRANVRAVAPDLRESRLTSTDAQGRFELKELPAGRWELEAAKAGFITLRFGQRRPFESGRPLELAEGQVLEKVEFALPRGSVVTGRVLDEFGDPVAGARVQVLRYRPFQGTRRLVPTGVGDPTDDTGTYRIYGLPPGDYYVSATLRTAFGDAPSGDTTGYAPTYYPGTGNAAEAQRVVLGLAQEQPNITFALLPTRSVKITGTVLSSSGNPLTGGYVGLTETTESADGFMMFSNIGARIRPDGSFTLSNVSPGPYTLEASTGAMGGEEVESASLRVTVAGEDLTGITLYASRGVTLTGTVVAAAGSQARLPVDQVRVIAQPLTPGRGMGSRPARVDSDGTFRLTGLQGRRLLRPEGLPGGWMLKSVLLDGADVTDTPIDFKGGADDIDGVQVVVTDRVTEVSGRVTTEKGAPVRDYTVIVFPEDTGKWTYPSRYLRAGRPDQDGTFRIRTLPPEDRYLAVAVDYLEDGEGGDPEFLQSMRDRATPFTLGEGDAKALELKLVTR